MRMKALQSNGNAPTSDRAETWSPYGTEARPVEYTNNSPARIKMTHLNLITQFLKEVEKFQIDDSRLRYLYTETTAVDW